MSLHKRLASGASIAVIAATGTIIGTSVPALALTAQTITFTAPPSTALSASPVVATATASSGLTVAFTSATTGVCTTTTGGTVTLLAVGTCTINANQAGNGTFSAAPQVAQSFAVTIGSQTISFTGPATSQLNASPVTVTATASSGLTVAFTSATTGICTVSGTSVTLVAVGTCTINANQAGTVNWTAAPQVAQSFSVTLNAQTINFTQPPSAQLTASPVTIAASTNGGLTVAFTSTTAPVCTVSGTTVTLVSTGTCTINADQAGNGTYAAAPTVVRSFQVTGSTTQTITFTGPSSTPLLTGTVTVSATAAPSALTVAFSSVSTGVCTVSGTTVTLLTVGTCVIHADQAGNGTYAAATTVSQSFAVTLTAQTISFTGPASTALNASPVTVTATASSGLTVAFTSATAPVCTVAGTTVTLVAVGTCTINANQAGNGTYSPATQVPQSFGVTIGSQTISFTAPGSTLLSAGTVTVSATASSGLTVAFTSATAPVCTVSGTTVTLVAVGTCTINANQAGTVNWNPATQVVQSFAVTVASSGGGTPPTTPAAPARVAGADRFATAIAASATEFPTTGSAGAVVLARSDDYPDALVGTALAAAKNAPLLFAAGGTLTAATSAEIQRVLTAGGTVYLLGGTAAIPASVSLAVTALGYVPVRYSGADRYATAIAVADALGDPATVLLATGTNFADALAAGPAAAHLTGVVLLTNGSTMPATVQAYLTAHAGTVYAVGGPAVAADPSATPLSGADRYATAAAVASTIFGTPTNVGVASGVTFPDALSGGAFQAHFGGPILLSAPTTLPPSTSTYLTGAKSTIVTTSVFGGTAALSDAVQTAVTTALGM